MSDAHLSSPEFTEPIKSDILATDCDVIDLGQIPTPLLATHTLSVRSGVMITGSHNPNNHNFVNEDNLQQIKPFFRQEISRILPQLTLTF